MGKGDDRRRIATRFAGVPVGLQPVLNPKISRRQLLGGVAVSPVMLGPTGAVASAADPLRYELRFNLSDDGSQLSIAEIEVSPPDRRVPHLTGDKVDTKNLEFDRSLLDPPRHRLRAQGMVRTRISLLAVPAHGLHSGRGLRQSGWRVRRFEIYAGSGSRRRTALASCPGNEFLALVARRR